MMRCAGKCWVGVVMFSLKIVWREGWDRRCGRYGKSGEVGRSNGGRERDEICDLGNKGRLAMAAVDDITEVGRGGLR